MVKHFPWCPVSGFVYLGTPVTTNGITFQGHVQRMASRLQRAAYLFKNTGCKGGGFDPGTCLHFLSPFLSPIIEYTVTLCPPFVKKNAQKALSSALRLITSGGTSSSALVLGLLGEIRAIEIRYLSLQYKFILKNLSKDQALLSTIPGRLIEAVLLPDPFSVI
jgi:hypothetical protein